MGSAYQLNGIEGLAQLAFNPRRRKLNVKMIEDEWVTSDLPLETEIRKKLIKINYDSAIAVRVKDPLQDQRLLAMTTYPIRTDLHTVGLPQKIRVIYFFY